MIHYNWRTLNPGVLTEIYRKWSLITQVSSFHFLKIIVSILSLPFSPKKNQQQQQEQQQQQQQQHID